MTNEGKLEEIASLKGQLSILNSELRRRDEIIKRYAAVMFEQACAIVCVHCAGKSPREMTPFPSRVNEDDYVCNYGEVKKGEWLHMSPYGEHTRCDAEKLWEFRFKLQEQVKKE